MFVYETKYAVTTGEGAEATTSEYEALAIQFGASQIPAVPDVIVYSDGEKVHAVIGDTDYSGDIQE